MESSESNLKPSIIIDNGSGFIKAGFGGEKEPKTIFPTSIGYLRFSGCTGFIDVKKEYFIGKNAERRIQLLKMDYPIKNGIITNWDDMEKIWKHIFQNELYVSPEENYVLLTEVPFNSNEMREKIAQIMFEHFNVPGLYIENQSLLVANYFGKTTGIILDSGDSIASCVPIVESNPISKVISYLNFSGRDVTEYFSKILAETGISFNTESKKLILPKIKEKVCYVALDYKAELKSIEPYDYELPDGVHILIKTQRIRCPEAFFNPSIMSKEGKGIAEICHESIQNCDKNLEKELYNNIILSGGNTMYEGFPERFSKEMKILAPGAMKDKINIFASNERKLAAWKGASILSTTSLFDDRWIIKKEYEERGTSIIHKK